MKDGYFKGSVDHPFHLSVGGVLVNEQGEVCCHYFKEITLKGEKFTDFYILMRETLHSGESLEAGLTRGFKEEFGMEGEIVTYLGSIKIMIPVQIEKTTVYFLARHVSDKSHVRSTEDIEMNSEIQWQKPLFLIDKMKAQAKRFGRDDVDESVIIERACAIL